MATTTTNYGLTKPSYGDNADIAVINSNMDKIDAKMKEIEDAGGGGASTWSDVANKPFETVGSGLSVDESGALNVTGGGSGGSSVSWNQLQTSGSKIAEVTIDGTKTDVYSPTGGSSGGGVEIKSFTYTGKGGNLELDITDINFILGIYGNGLNGTNVSMLPFHVDACGFITVYRNQDKASGGFLYGCIERTGNTLILKGANDDGGRCNISGYEYTVHYI